MANSKEKGILITLSSVALTPKGRPCQRYAPLSGLSLQPASAWTVLSVAQGPLRRLGLAVDTWHSGTEPGCGPGWQPTGNKRLPRAEEETPSLLEAL